MGYEMAVENFYLDKWELEHYSHIVLRAYVAGGIVAGGDVWYD